MAADNTQPVNRIERVLAFMALGLVLLGLGCIVAVIWGTGAGMGQGDFQLGLWPTVGATPLFAFPAAMLLIIALTIIVGVRRSREAQSGENS